MEVLVCVAEAPNGMSIWMPKTTWQAGETATGKVKICLKARTTVRAVKLKWHGVAHCHWHTGVGKNRHDYSKSIDVIPETTSTLFEPQGDHHFEGGQHYEYPFSVVLPKNAPPAFEYHDNTYIRYQLKGYVDIPNWPDHEVLHHLQVLSGPEHMAVPPSAMEPITKADTQIVHTCCCCGKAGMADLSLSVSSGVLYFDEFAPQGITATVSLKNDSTRAFSKVALHVNRVVELKTSWNSHRTEQTVYTEALKETLAPQETLTNKQVIFRPAVKPTASVGQEANAVHVPSFSTDVIVVSYVVIFKASNGCASDPQVDTPLSVVPVDRSLYAQQQGVPMMLPSNMGGMPYAYNPDFPPGTAPANYYQPTQGYYPPQTGYDGSGPPPSAYAQYGAPSAYAPAASYPTGGYPNPSYDAPPPKYA